MAWSRGDAGVRRGTPARCGVPGSERPRLWELSCWGGGWVYTYPTGENLFQSGAACNFSNYQDARADELIARTVTADDLGALHEYQE